MPCKLVLRPSFPDLLDSLYQHIEILCDGDPLGPKWVLVPTSTLANHLRRWLGQRAKSSVFAGVRIAPVATFLRRLGNREGVRSSRWGANQDLLLFELVEELPRKSTLARLQNMPGGHRLLSPTFLDLADAGFGPEQGELLSELAEESDLVPAERETLRLYRQWILSLQSRQIGWDPLLHQQIPNWIREADDSSLLSVLACEENQTPEVLVYGFYDFTDVNTEIIVALSHRISVTLFYPFLKRGQEVHPAFSFGEMILEDLKIRLGTRLIGTEVEGDEPDGVTEVSKYESTRYFGSTFPEGNVPSQPAFLTFQRAAGIRAELTAAAVQIRQWMDDLADPTAPDAIMVVAPRAEVYLRWIGDVFAAFGIPLRIIDVPLGPTPNSHPVQMLARIWEDRAPAEWVLAYLRECPDIPAALDVNLEEFERKVRQVKLWGGPSWQLILEVDPDQPNLAERNLPHFNPPERALVREIVSLWCEDAGSLGRSFNPSEAGAILERIRAKWLTEPSLLDPLMEALEVLGSFRPELLLKESLLRELLRQVVGPEIGSDSFDQRGVLFLPLMRARGVTSKRLVILGLASGSLPWAILEDPLLSDLARGRLSAKARLVGHRIPIKSRLTEELCLLFFLFNTSAQSVHWVVPESDDGGRSVSPTPWVQRYLQRWKGPTEDAQLHQRIPCGPVQQAEYLWALDRGTGSFLPPSFLVFVRPDMAEILTDGTPYGSLLRAINSRRQDICWNGHIPGASLPTEGVENQRIRVTDLELLSKCPYRYYAERFVEWTPLVPLELAEEMHPMDWGAVVHLSLEELIKPHPGQGATVKEIAVSLLETGAGNLNQRVRALTSRFPITLGMLPPVFRQAAVEKLVSILTAYFEEVVQGRCSGDLPIELEFKKRVPFPGLGELLISGRIDRIDRQGGHLHIYDYKSGRAPSLNLEREVFLGYRIQPILYPWIVSGELQSTGGDLFSYIFLGDSPPREKLVDRPSDVEAFLGPIGEILKRGIFLPTPTETMELAGVTGASPCQFCRYESLCRRFDRGAHHRYLRFLRKKLPFRLQALGVPQDTRQDKCN